MDEGERTHMARMVQHLRSAQAALYDYRLSIDVPTTPPKVAEALDEIEKARAVANMLRGGGVQP